MRRTHIPLLCALLVLLYLGGVSPASSVVYSIDKIQAAIGAGGDVTLGSGTFVLESQLELVGDATLSGQGPSTILKIADGAIAALTSNALAGQVGVEVETVAGFRAGQIVAIRDDNGWGVFKIALVDGATKTVVLATNLGQNYTVAANAVLFTHYPAIYGEDVSFTEIRNLRIDGNAVNQYTYELIGNADPNRTYHGESDAGIYLDGHNFYITIADFIITATNGHGVFLVGTHHSTIKDFILDGIGDKGIAFHDETIGYNRVSRGSIFQTGHNTQRSSTFSWGDGIQVHNPHGPYYDIQDVFIREPRRHGVHIDGYTPGFGSHRIVNVTVVGPATYNDTAGIFVGGRYTLIEGAKIIGMPYGIVVGQANLARGTSQSNHAQEIMISNPEIRNSGRHGVWVVASSHINSIRGGVIEGSSSQSAGVYSNIYLGGHGNLVGEVILREGDNDPKYGVEIGPGALYSTIVNLVAGGMDPGTIIGP